MVNRRLNKLTLLIIFIGIFAFFFFRLYRLPERLNFYYDSAQLLIFARDSWNLKKFSLIGPIDGPTVVNGRGIFFGGAYNYITILLAILGSWNPLSMAGLVVVAQFIAVAGASIVVSKRLGKTQAILFFLISASLPVFVNYSNWLWNPNYGIILGFVALIFVELANTRKKSVYFFLLGLVVGITLQLHYLYWLIVPILLLHIFLRHSLGKSLIYLVGIGFGYLPIIVFELRNNFYNTTTALIFIKYIIQKRGAHLIYSDRYIAIFSSYILYLAIKLLSHFKKYRFLLLAFLTATTVFMGISMNNSLKAVRFGITNDWGYQDQLKVADIIYSEKEEYYNLANLVYADTREYPIRYLLEQKGQKIMPVDAYPRTNILYVASKDNPLGHSVWEIDSIKPAKIIKVWEINPDVKLYKIERIIKI